MAISTSVPQCCEEIITCYSSDPATLQLMSKLAVTPSSVPNFTLEGGLIIFKDRIWLGANTSLHQKVMNALHGSAVGGHSGIPVTYRRVKQLFAWPGLKTSVQEFVSSCQICQQAKSERVKNPGLLEPLPIPKSAWQIISMDFIEGLPRSGGKNCILVVVDKFSKFSHFVPLSHPFTAGVVAKTFMQQVYRLHGMPLSIISDRDRIFTSQLWQELFKLANVQLRMSSAYHPQSDGQTECVNQCVEQFLRCFVHACPSKWVDWIYLAEFWYNASWHSALKMSPFEALYGQKPCHLGITAAVHAMLLIWMRGYKISNRCRVRFSNNSAMPNRE